MAHVVVAGGALDRHTHELLMGSGHLLTFAPLGLERFAVDEFGRAVLFCPVASAGAVRPVSSTARHNKLPWVAWNRNDSAAVALASYESGASAVLPAAFSTSAFDGIVRTMVSGGHGSVASREPELHAYLPGDRITLAADAVLWVREGVVALTELHEDGTECLNGFCAPGQVVTGSVDSAVQPVAHTTTTVSVQPWSHAVRQPGFAALLRERLQEAQAWVHSRGHHNVDTRLLATLDLLADKFGVDDEAGTLVDIQLTHAQLAAATASTRATVTRRLAALSRRGLLTTVTMASGTRLALRKPRR